jgi:hypothetical protein
MRAIVRLFLTFAVLVLIYVGTYALLSLNGSYVSSQTGDVRLANGGPVINDVQVWRPKFVRLRIFLNERGEIEREANFLGWFFYPLELMDRRHWHLSRHPFLELLKGLTAPPAGGNSRLP